MIKSVYTMTFKRFLSVFILTFFVKFGFSQVYQSMPQYGYGPVKRFDVDSTLTIPTVCGVPTLKSNLVRKSAIAFDTCNNRFYTYNSKTLTWSQVTGGGGGSTDTTSLSNRINTKIDSLKRSTDSVFAKINGTWYFQYKDSLSASDTASVVKATVHNAEATTLTKGTVVYLFGATGNIASVKRAYNISDTFSSKTFAVVRNDIPAGGNGIVVTQGVVDKLNLGAYNEGDIVWLDSIPGQFTKVKPSAPYHQVFIGVVERANNGNGQLFVKVTNGFELGELHNVSVNGQSDNDVLYYQSSTKLWKSKSPYQLVDTTKLSTRIDQRVKYSDTATMLTNYQRSSFAVKYVDTATMLSNYQKSSFAVKYADTSNMLSTYQRSISAMKYTDTATMLSKYLRSSTADATYQKQIDTIPLFVFGAGSGASTDTSAFTTSAIYGSFYNDYSDTIIVTAIRIGLRGTSPSINAIIYFNDSLGTTAGATQIISGGTSATNIHGGTVATSITNNKIAPGNWIWVQTNTLTTKPTYFILTLFGYRKPR